jgi:signal transduction histidine kinase/CheY-like chemotaxis protein
VFPVCFVDGVGLTAFKKASEYVIIALLGAYAVLVWRRRSWLEPSTRQRIVVSTLFLMAAEFAFTQYRDITGTANTLGHILLCVSFTFTYSAFVEATLRRPLRNLFGTLARSEERYRSLFENTPLAKWEEDWSAVKVLVDSWVQADGPDLIRHFDLRPEDAALALSSIHVVDANRATLAVFGITRPEFLGHGLEPVLADATAEHIRDEILTFYAGTTTVTHDVSLRRADGESRTGVLSVTLLPEDRDSWRNVVVTFQDNTDLIRAHEENDEVKAHLMQAQKLESLGILAGGIAHDFNNLLTSITGFSDLLAADLPADSPLQEHVASIRKAASSATVITRQLLTFARRQPRHVERLDLNAILSGVQAILGSLLGERIALAFYPRTALEPFLADPSQIEQAVMNLAINARDAMHDAGTVTLRTGTMTLQREEPPVAADGHEPGTYAWFEVSDTGSGIDPDVLPHIFDPFFTTKKLGKGTGLGLSVVQGVAQEHGGWVDVTTSPGTGTSFRVFLKMEASVESDPIGTPHQPFSPSVQPSTGSVLVVDDDAGIVRFLQRALSFSGCTVIAAASVHEACALLADDNTHIDILMTDYVLPDGNGLDIARAAWAGRPALPVILMTGYVPEDLDQDVIGRVAAQLSKPFTLAELQEAIARARTAL